MSRGQPWAADWEYIVGRDLVPHLIPAGQPQGAYLSAGTALLAEGAVAALSGRAGHVELADMLVAPAAARRCRGWRGRYLYTPLSVAGIGEHGAGLWVRALPVPGVRAYVTFSDIAAVEHRCEGPWHVLAVTGAEGQWLVRFDEDGERQVAQWIRRLRLRAAPVSAAVPPAPPGGQGQRAALDPDAFGLDAADDIVSAGWRSPARRVACLLAVTSRELVVVQCLPEAGRPWHAIRRTLYMPRRSIRAAAARAGTVCVRTAGSDVTIRLWSGQVAAAASCWLNQVLPDLRRPRGDC